ncbi:MAG: response regulator [Candidatus Omnitrophota bacterium]
MGKNKKILIIDDNEQDQKAMTVALRKAGYGDIASAQNQQEGIQKTASLCPAIIFIDVVLGSVDGFDVCRQIKSLNGCQAKIIMVTGHLDAVEASKAKASGADEIIEKTFGFANLSKTIESIL